LAKNAKADRLPVMGTKNISLPEELSAFVDAKVASGEYAHASEVVRDGLRLLMREESTKLEWIRGAIAKGEADIAAGRTIPAERVWEELAKPHAARAVGRRKRNP
jgi:antitoxin ParD1/3/4